MGLGLGMCPGGAQADSARAMLGSARLACLASAEAWVDCAQPGALQAALESVLTMAAGAGARAAGAAAPVSVAWLQHPAPRAALPAAGFRV